MKKLLGVIGVMALAAALLPAQGYADLRGSFSLVTNGISDFGLANGAEQGATRPGMIMNNPLDPVHQLERWMAFSTRSLVPGREGVRSIWQIQNLDQSVLRTGALFALREDPNADISYFDPAWSYDGKYLAYVQTNLDGSAHGLYVQEFTLSTSPSAASTPVGSPILVVGTGNPRRPNWHPSQYTLAYDSPVDGSPDLYTIDVDVVGGMPSTPVKRTFVGNKAETQPSWNPASSSAAGRYDIAYATNKFGPNVVELLDVDLSPADPAYTKLAETNFNFVSHNNPDWTPSGEEIYYDAPAGEDPSAVTSVWKLNLATQAKCEIQLDVRADADPDVSGITNTSTPADGVPFNYFLFNTQAAGQLNVWRGNPVNSCVAPLPMGVRITPQNINIKQQGNTFTLVLQFPPETKAHGFVMRQGNIGGEGVRNRNSIFASPTLLGLPQRSHPTIGGIGFCEDGVDTLSVSPFVTERILTCFYSRRTIVERMVALGLTDRVVPLETNLYSNRSGRRFKGFAYVKVSQGGSSSASSVMLLGNSPNPFNPLTKITFAVNKAGTYALRVYSVQGALVRTLANRPYGVGTHEVAWDGRTSSGGKAASGVYYAKISGANRDESDAIRVVMAK